MNTSQAMEPKKHVAFDPFKAEPKENELKKSEPTIVKKHKYME